MVRERGTAALRGNLDLAEGCKLGDSTVAILWRTASADTAQLSLLSEATGYMGGAQALRVVVRTLGDRSRPTLVRLAALATIVPYLEPADACANRLLDTLRESPLGCSVDHPSYRASSSIEPVLRDSIRAALRFAGTERGAIGRAAESLSIYASGPEKLSDSRAMWCRRAGKAFAAALRMSTSPLVSDELRGLAECTESGPAALVLAWRAVPADSAALEQLVRISATVRDRRIYYALLAVARDSSRPTPIRVAAVDAISPLLHPALYWFRSGRNHGDPSRSCSGWGFFSHEAVQEEGAEPMGAGSRRDGVAEMMRLANENVPTELSDAARTVARCAEGLLAARPPELW